MCRTPHIHPCTPCPTIRGLFLAQAEPYSTKKALLCFLKKIRLCFLMPCRHFLQISDGEGDRIWHRPSSSDQLHFAASMLLLCPSLYLFCPAPHPTSPVDLGALASDGRVNDMGRKRLAIPTSVLASCFLWCFPNC